MEKQDAFFNRAKVEAGSSVCCDSCFEQVIFLLRDKDHEFTIGLTDVLKCLRFAEEEGEVPRLPNEWWIDIINRFDIGVE